MNDKFSDFLKNYGLIIIGYNGNDRSIMDALNSLLKRDDYLNNGIYWCIRRNDIKNINENVRKLLWKDKVYFVLIDGFDEFFAELNCKIFKDCGSDWQKLPCNTDIVNNISRLMSYLSKSKKEHSHCNYIRNDIDECIKRLNAQNIDRASNNSNIIEQSDYDNEESYGQENNLVLTNEIISVMRAKKFNKALQLINDLKADNKISISSMLMNKLLKMKIECYIELKENEKAIETCDELINYNARTRKSNNLMPYLYKAMIHKDTNEILYNLNKALEEDYYYGLTHYKLASIKGNLYPIYSFEEIIEHYDKSIEIQPSIENSAYEDKLLFIQAKKSEKAILEYDKSIELLEKQDKYASTVFNLKNQRFALQEKKKKDENPHYIYYNLGIKNILDEYIQNNTVHSRIRYYLSSYIDTCKELNLVKNLREIFNDYDEEYSNEYNYILSKASSLLSNFRDLDGSINLLTRLKKSKLMPIKNKTKRAIILSVLCQNLYYAERYNEAKAILEDEFDLLDTTERFIKSLYTDILFKVDKDNFEEYAQYYFEESKKTPYDYMHYTYQLLKLGRYNDIYNLLNDCFSSNKYRDDDVLVINYQLARKNINKKVKDLDSIIDRKGDSLVKSAALFLHGSHYDDKSKKTEALDMLNRLIREDYENFYKSKEYPIFGEIDFNQFKFEPLPIYQEG